MSIKDKTGQIPTITEGSRALDLFTNRERLIEIFIRHLNEDPLREKILFFYGDGGNGKSLLRLYLQKYFCKRFDRESWNWIKANFSDDALVKKVKEQAQNLQPNPSAALDFGLKTTAEDRPQEAFYGLLMLRRQLAASGIRFPLFDFACVWYLLRTNQLSQERLKTLFPAEGSDLVSELFNAVSGTSVAALAKAVLNIFTKTVKEDITVWLHKRGLDANTVAAIQQMDPEKELIGELPDLFASDLNAAVRAQGGPGRVVLFFDTHEAFWGHQRDMPNYFAPDKWLRCLLISIDLSEGIVAVIAGREPPKWKDAPPGSNIPAEFLEPHLVGHLSPPDADDYLKRAGIEDVELRGSLIKYTEVEPEEVHPLYLGLAADVVLAARKQGQDLTAGDFPAQPMVDLKEKELIDRLLSYVDTNIKNAVIALAAARSFNREIYTSLGKKLNFSSTDADFDVLRGFSFVWAAERRGEGWYRIHDLLRKLLVEHHAEAAVRAHAALELYHLNLAEDGDETGRPEAVYHANRIDPERGVNEWTGIFEGSLKLSRIELCRSLLDVRREMIIPNDFQLGFVSQLEGNFHFALSFYSEAVQEYNESIAAYGRALSLAPGDVDAHNNKGVVLQSRGDLEAKLTRYDDALKNYAESVAAFDRALSLAPDYGNAHNNKGNVLQRRGDLEAMRTRHDDALKSYAESVAAYDRALSLAPDDSEVHNNKGSALQRRGDLEAMLTRHDEALKSYAESAAAFDRALSLAPDYPEIYNNKGLVLESRGDLGAMLTRHDEALKSYAESVAAYDRALSLAPDYVFAHNNKGNVLQSRGDLESRLTRHDDALKSYVESVAAFDRALSLAPDEVAVYNNKGLALQSRGDLESRLTRHDDALKSYTESVAAYDRALSLAPDYVAAHNNKGNLLQRRGDLETMLTRHDDALKSYAESVAAYDRVLSLAPDLVNAHNNKGSALQSRGDLETLLTRHEDALKSYAESILAYDRALSLAPDYVKAHNNKGLVLQNRAVLRFSLEQIAEGIEDLELSMKEYSNSLKLAPNDEGIKNRYKVITELIDSLSKDNEENGSD